MTTAQRERPLLAYPIDPKTQEGPQVALKVDAADGPFWTIGTGFHYYDDEANITRLLFESGGQVVRPRCFAFLEEIV